MVISGVVGGSCVLLVILIFFSYVVYSRLKEEDDKEETEDADVNPDYGVDYDGIEYQACAVKDTNIYYGEEDSDYDDMDTVEDPT